MLNRREGSVGRAHLPCCPRLGRLIIGKSETVQTTVRDTIECFYLYEVPLSCVTRQVIGPRVTRSWLEHLDDETLDVVGPDGVECGVAQDLLKTCASFEPVSEIANSQIWMTAIVMGDVNAVYTLECTRRQPLNERSLLIRGLSFSRTITIGDVYIDDLVILSVLLFFRRACRFVAH